MTDASASPADHDRTALERLVRFGGRRLLESMIEIFRTQSRERMAAAEAAAASGNVEDARLAFHSLKSSAAQLGAVRLSELCREGEERAGAGATSELAPLAERSREALERSIAWMERVQAEITRP